MGILSSSVSNPQQDPVLGVYDIVGEQKLTELVSAFYRRVEQDDILGPMYQQSLAREPGVTMRDAEERLALFLIQRCGGPTKYGELRGHPRLRMRHMPFRIDTQARDRWLRLMSESMIEVELDPEAERRLSSLFVHIADFMRNAE